MDVNKLSLWKNGAGGGGVEEEGVDGEDGVGGQCEREASHCASSGLKSPHSAFLSHLHVHYPS